MLFPDQDKVDQISNLIVVTNPEILGDIFEKAIRIRATINDEFALKFSEIPMRKLRAMASREPGSLQGERYFRHLKKGGTLRL